MTNNTEHDQRKLSKHRRNATTFTKLPTTNRRKSELFTQETYSTLQGDGQLSQETSQKLRDLEKGLDKNLHQEFDSDQDSDDELEEGAQDETPMPSSFNPPPRAKRKSLLTDFFKRKDLDANGDAVQYPQLP
jgi:hypothetical protein